MLQRRLLAKRLAEDPIVGDYQITDEELGEGSTGVVRIAKHITSNTFSAVKILYKKNPSSMSPFASPASSPSGPSSSYANNAAVMSQRLKDEANREIELLKKLQHPNIIRLLDIIEEDAYVFIFMEFMEEGDLYNYIQRNGAFTEDRACHLFQQMVSALACCHESKVCHHDFKLENCVIDKNLSLRVIDFGYAFHFGNRPTGPNEKSDLFYHFTGSPAYSALEVLDRKPHNESVDIFSLGTCLYYLLSAEFPFCDETKTTYEQLCRNVRQGRIRFPDHFSPEVKDLLSHMLVNKAEQRIKLEDILMHPWLVKHNKHVPPVAFKQFSHIVNTTNNDCITVNKTSSDHGSLMMMTMMDLETIIQQ